MEELVTAIVVGVIGLFIGGCVGVHLNHGFSPDCWYGFLVGFAIGAGCWFVDTDF